MRNTFTASIIGAVALGTAGIAGAATPSNFSQDFEINDAGWNVFAAYNSTRVASGTNGVTSAGGAFHSEAAQDGDAAGTRWGAYSTDFAAYTTSLDIYLDVGAAYENDSRFDFTSAVNTPAVTPTHRRDFVFNGGFYDSTDITGPGAGGDRFVFSASNGAGPGNSNPKNPARSPISIDDSGWYTFTHEFRDNGAGVLEVELSILDASDTLVGNWTLSDPTDVIGTTVGGNRYGLIMYNEIPDLAFDNSSLTVVPEPAGFALLGLGGAALLLRRRRRA